VDFLASDATLGERRSQSPRFRDFPVAIDTFVRTRTGNFSADDFDAGIALLGNAMFRKFNSKITGFHVQSTSALGGGSINSLNSCSSFGFAFS
jgi:hypothetical protein